MAAAEGTFLVVEDNAGPSVHPVADRDAAVAWLRTNAEPDESHAIFCELRPDGSRWAEVIQPHEYEEDEDDAEPG